MGVATLISLSVLKLPRWLPKVEAVGMLAKSAPRLSTLVRDGDRGLKVEG